MCKAPDVMRRRRSDVLLYPACGRVGCNLQGTAQPYWPDTNRLLFLVDAHKNCGTLLRTFLHFPSILPAYVLQIHDPARYIWAPNSAYVPEICNFMSSLVFSLRVRRDNGLSIMTQPVAEVSLQPRTPLLSSLEEYVL